MRDLFTVLPRDTRHIAQKQHKALQSCTNNLIKTTLSLVVAYEHSGPAKISFLIILRLSNIAIIGAISAKILYFWV